MKPHAKVTYANLKGVLEGIVRAMPGHNVFTPFPLVEEMLALIFKNAGGKKQGLKIAVFYNTEFILTLIEKYKIKPANITLFGDDDRKEDLAKAWKCDYYDVSNLLNGDAMRDKQKYDVVVGNPPYQSGTAASHQGGHTSWDKFVVIAFTKLVKLDGYVALIHPSGWRNIGGSLSRVAKLLKSIDMKFLATNSTEQGMETFGKATPFDYYVAQNSQNADTLTKIRDVTGKVTHLDIKDMSFIPNFAHNLANKFIAKDGEEKVDLIHERSMYGTDKANMSEAKTAKYKYPCVKYIPVDAVDEKDIDFLYSSQNNGMFGKPKVMFGTMANVGGIMADKKGKFGLCEFTAGIVDKPENLDAIRSALKSEKFQMLMRSVQFTTQEYSYRIIREFRKDFWKDFV